MLRIMSVVCNVLGLVLQGFALYLDTLADRLLGSGSGLGYPVELQEVVVEDNRTLPK